MTSPEGPPSPATAGMLAALRRGDLAGTRELRLPGLDVFPEEIFGLADSLEVLDLSGGRLTELPADMGRLARLRVLFLSGNRFERMPAALGGCPALSQIGLRGTGLREVPGEALPPRLRWLTLTDNRIERLPAALGARPELQKLLVAGNRLTALPESLADASRLELIRLAANAFGGLPAWLPTLPSLAWASWAGNPLERTLPADPAARVAWSDIALAEKLGEGASGVVHRASWRQADGPPRPIALKLFKGAMTSDGLPEREMAACLAAGEHPNLTGALGRIEGHPEGRDGLAMRLLPARWRVLAGPPSLASCSRDVYDPGLRLRPDAALRIARGIAAAAAHLHARGTSHSDLYAHNILWDGAGGEAVLSDFGAASMMREGAAGVAWQRVESRAFGLLLGELLARCDPAPGALARLRALEQACIQPDAAARPFMADVLDALGPIRADADDAAQPGSYGPSASVTSGAKT